MIERTVNRRQKPQYESGSKKEGFYVFSVQGVERINKIHIQYFSLEGTGFTVDDAKVKAWRTAIEWVKEVGELIVEDTQYKAMKVI